MSKVAKESAQGRADYPRYLSHLCELERIDRERRCACPENGNDLLAIYGWKSERRRPSPIGAIARKIGITY